MGWSPDTVVGWSPDTVVGWSPDTVVGWSPDTVVGWSPDTVVGWSPDRPTFREVCDVQIRAIGGPVGGSGDRPQLKADPWAGRETAHN